MNQNKSHQIESMPQFWMKILEQLHDTVYPRSLRHATPHHHHAIRCCVALYHIIPSHITPYRVVPQLTMPHHTTPCQAIKCHAMLWRIASHWCTAHQIKPNHTSRYHILPHHNTPYHTTPHMMPMSLHSKQHITIRSYYTLPQHLETTSDHSTTHTHTHMYSKCYRIVTFNKSIRLYQDNKTRMSENVKTWHIREG